MNQLITTFIILHSFFAPTPPIQNSRLENSKSRIAQHLKPVCAQYLHLSNEDFDRFRSSVNSVKVYSLKKSNIPVAFSGLGKNLNIQFPLNEFTKLINNQPKTVIAPFLNKPVIFLVDNPKDSDILIAGLAHVRRMTVDELDVQYGKMLNSLLNTCTSPKKAIKKIRKVRKLR